MLKNFTKQHLDWFRRYKEVQKSGLFNMFDPEARRLTGLTKEQYVFVMENYSKLEAESLVE